MPVPNSQCVILVPVGGSIVPECDAALQELERRGYVVRRIRGFSQVDVARNQIATEALRDGFEELFWIDSDVVFNPDDVDRLRQCGEPFVCAVYPKKGPQEFACNYLPGTESVVFGQGGGLTEMLYVGFGFNYTHRSVYERVRQHCQLPVCNLQFGEALIPFFMPLAKTDAGEPWYLGEDYAFCERVRQCGYRIMVDTTIRLWHVGTYKYSWEDAGGKPQRFATYSFKTGIDWSPSPPKETGYSLPASLPGLDQLRAEFPWPTEMPTAIPRLNHGWLHESVQQLLRDELQSKPRLILELGSWLGLSTRFLLKHAPQARIISVDHWRGSPEHHANPDLARWLPVLYETFLVNCWGYRQQLLPLRMDTQAGIDRVASAGLAPDLIYLDADHSYEAVQRDLRSLLACFPKAIIVGDDWDWEGVQRAAAEIAQQSGRRLETHGVGWKLC